MTQFVVANSQTQKGSLRCLAKFDKDTGLSFYLNELNNQFANRTNNISIFIDNLTTFLRFLHNNSLIDESEKMF